MKTTAWKVFLDYEKEEKWLNEMSAKGFALTDFSFCRYAFADCEPGEYIYRIELLENVHGHPESQKYIGFMEENGVEHIASWVRWVYFRKKAEYGPFDIFSDIGSRLTHYKRILALFFPIMCMEFLLGISQFHWGFPLNNIAGIFIICLGVAFLIVVLSLRRKIKALKQEQLLHE